MAHQYHVACVLGDDGVGVGGGIVKELVDFFHFFLCGGSLLRGEGSKHSEHHQIDGAFIVEENADELLDFVLSALERGRRASSPLEY